MMKHNWTTIEVGNTYSEYECIRCKLKYVEVDEDAGSKPDDGCVEVTIKNYNEEIFAPWVEQLEKVSKNVGYDFRYIFIPLLVTDKQYDAMLQSNLHPKTQKDMLETVLERIKKTLIELESDEV